MAGLINFSDGQLRNSLRNSFQDISALGNIPQRVHDYLGKGEVVPPPDIAESEQQKQKFHRNMWQFLQSRGADLSNDAVFNAGGYDELLFGAYDQALRQSRGADDPLAAANSGGGSDAMQGWDFTVDGFESVDAQGILPESIRAAGAIDYVYELGERMRIFDIADQLVLGWASGSIDIAQGEAAGKLYRYWKLLDDRSSLDERAALYRRVLNKGNAKTIGKAVINENFPNIWGALMTEIADYIDKSEKLDSGGTEVNPVSIRPIHQALRELQYNLTEYCTGMAFMQVREMYAQLQQALDILKDPDVIASFGGVRRRNMWTVVTEISKEAFGSAPPVSPIVRMAVDGNRIFQLAADFDEGTFSPRELEELINAGESYIINSSMVNDEPEFSGDDEMDEDNDEFTDEFEEF